MDWELLRWFGRAIEKMNVVDYGIELSRPANGESGGFLADVAFAKLIITTEDGGTKIVNLICKYGKKGPYREAVVFSEIYEREVFFYERIVPALHKLAKAKHFLFDSIPKCYATIFNEKEEVVILENLTYQGFKMYPVSKPMTLEHMRLVLDEYAKFHALSFAFREQRREEFKKLTANYSNVMEKAFSKCWLPFMEICANKMYEYLMEAGEVTLAHKFKTQLLDIGCRAILEKSFEIDPEECIIIHTDANNNNFLFKYKKESGEPIKAMIIDFQLSILHSPVLDVIVFLTYVSAREQIAQHDQMLEFYYDRLATYLTRLGNHIDKCFPLETFKRHLDRYSCYVLVLMNSIPTMVVEREKKMDLDADGDVTDLVPDLKFEDVKDIITDRIVPLMKRLFKI